MHEGNFWIWCLYFVLIVVLYETVRKLRGYKYVDDIKSDERTGRIAKQSLSVSWCLTFAIVGTLAFVCISNPELLTARLVIAAVSGGMIGSFLVAHCYYSRKGDV